MSRVRSFDADDPAFTAVRGFAELWVFVYHAWLTAGPASLRVSIGNLELDFLPLASCGWAGVDVFFVLSGFLLWGFFDDWASRRTSHVNLSSYFGRRAARILPPYYGQLVLLVMLSYTIEGMTRPAIPDLAWHATLMHGSSPRYWQSINPVWWTLTTEAQFYVALPLLAWLVRRSGWAVALALGLATMLAWRYGMLQLLAAEPVERKVWGIEQFPGRIDQFMAGMFARHLVHAREGWPVKFRSIVVGDRRLRRALLASGGLSLLALSYRLHIDDMYLRFWNGNPWLYGWHLVAGIGIALSLYAIALRPTPAIERGKPAVSRWMRPLVAVGTISYSFYLWHELLLRALKPLIMKFADGGTATLTTFALALTLGFIVTRAAALLSYELLERPFLRARVRLHAA